MEILFKKTIGEDLKNERLWISNLKKEKTSNSQYKSEKQNV